jgi:hypothetical protein
MTGCLQICEEGLAGNFVACGLEPDWIGQSVLDVSRVTVADGFWLIYTSFTPCLRAFFVRFHYILWLCVLNVCVS